MNGTVDRLAPKRIRNTESTDVSENQAIAQAARAFQAKWSRLPKDLVSEIGLQLNKHAVMRLRCANKKFLDDLDTSETIKRPLTAIRDDFKQEVGELKSNADIPAYMYEGVKELTGHTYTVDSITQLTDGRIVSGSMDNTLRVWDLAKQENEDGYVRELTGHRNRVAVK